MPSKKTISFLNAEYKVLNDVVKAIRSPGLLPDILGNVLKAIMQFEEIKVEQKAGIFLADKERKVLKLFCTLGKFSEEFLEKEKEVPFGDCLCGRVAESKQLLMSESCFTDSRHERKFEDMTAHGHYIIPLKSEAKLIGVMFLYTDTNPSWYKHSQEILMSIGGVIGDAIERKLSDSKLRKSESRLHAILESTVDAIITIDEKGTIKSFNKAAEKVFGYSKDDILGEKINALMPEPYKSEHDSYIQNYLQTGNAKIIGMGREAVAQRKDGSVFPMDIAISEISDDSKKIFIGLVRDITEKKRTEENLKRSEKKAAAANLAKSKFLSNMSHELRTPLNAILGFGQLLDMDIEGNLTEQQGKNVKSILTGGNHLLDLINEVLDLSKIEAGHMDFSIEKIQVKSSLQEPVTLAKPLADKLKIKIEISSDHDFEVYALADKKRFNQVILNLISNAIKYNKVNGLVKITYGMFSSNQIFIRIQDSGFGIPVEKQKEIFEPFCRLDKDIGMVEGTGIGLAITKQLVEHMNGTITLESSSVKGSCFTVILPMEIYCEKNI